MRLERQFSAAPMDPGSRAISDKLSARAVCGLLLPPGPPSLSTEYAKVIRRIIVSEKSVTGWNFELGWLRGEITEYATTSWEVRRG